MPQDAAAYDREMEDDPKDGDEGARARSRLVWTPELHERFMNAVNHLGVKHAVPKTILQLMNVEGLTRENVASHLQVTIRSCMIRCVPVLCAPNTTHPDPSSAKSCRLSPHAATTLSCRLMWSGAHQFHASVHSPDHCRAPVLTTAAPCHAQKYRLYLKRLAGVPLNAPISAEALQRVQEVQQVRQT